MALNVPIISVRYARRYLRFVQKHGINGTIVLENADIDPAILDNPEGFLSIKQVSQILRHGNRLLNDETTGFRFGQELDLHGHGLFGFALLRQKNYRHLVNMVVQYLRVSLPLMDMEIKANGEEISIQLHDNWEFGDLKPTIAGIYMGSIYSLASLVSKRFTFEFDFPCPGKSLQWQQLAKGGTMRFDQPQNRVLMPLVGRQMRDDDASMANYLAAARSQEQLKCNDSLKVVTQVRHQIMTSPGRSSSLERVAEQLGMSSRSVRRHLNLAGYGFSTIRNQVRETFATRFLQDTDMPLEKIAEHIGYSDQASFSKAYRSWTGKTPGEVRRAHRQ